MADIKVVLAQRVLGGSNQSGSLQRVATVYIDGNEYRVSAPPEATGDALEWMSHLKVRQWDSFGGEVELGWNGDGLTALQAVKRELEQQRSSECCAAGMHPDGLHCAAQICLKGHVRHYDGRSFNLKEHCTKCGAACIAECRHCGEPIRGAGKFGGTYARPQYCHRCGEPYPWMGDRLQTARELLYHDEQLTMDDRTKLFDLLKDVMSDPLSELAPAKKKLIEINLGKATEYVREFILDLVAKIATESLKN